MFHSDVHCDIHYDTPTGGELLAEIGIDRDTVIEVIEEDRSTRCPDRDAVLPDRPSYVTPDDDTPWQEVLYETPFNAFPGVARPLPPEQ